VYNFFYWLVFYFFRIFAEKFNRFMKKIVFFFALFFGISHFCYSQTDPIEDEIFLSVEDRPEFPGGDEARLRFFAEHINYPQHAIDSGIHGRVFVQFVIEKDGRVTDVKVIRGIGGGCDEEVVRVVEMMPNWKPGTIRGEPVRVQFTMPVPFAISQPKNQCEGTVYLSFRIEEGNKLSNIGVMAGIDNDCDELAITLMKDWFQEMPKLDLKHDEYTTVLRVGVKFIPDQEPEIVEQKDFVQTAPKFPGGDEARQKFLRDNIKYPTRDRDKGIQGTVFIQFVVERDGSVVDVHVARGIGEGCDAEAVRVVQLMQKWEPGTIGGKPARVQFMLPIRFSFEEPEPVFKRRRNHYGNDGLR
jgi:TonB family protein